MINKWLNKVAAVLLIIFVAGGLAACANESPTTESESVATVSESQVEKTGVLYVRVNPEVAVYYDEKGKVTALSGKNDDGTTIVEQLAAFEGLEVRDVVMQLVSTIGEAGYFIEEVEGKARKVTIELERGSILPSTDFLSDIVQDVRDVVSNQGWKAPVTSPPVEEVKQTDVVNEHDDSNDESNHSSESHLNDDSNEGDDVSDSHAESNHYNASHFDDDDFDDSDDDDFDDDDFDDEYDDDHDDDDD
ncbi:anti-sigma-I factor RsgI family protein [Jeotgalibaca sp. A127]|uniref:anti-sigma-I factor RsgI family protein n=1 Tax=Jeotgalibaca sp. A127 TaxID=3457324 RepID=UPI003FD4169F